MFSVNVLLYGNYPDLARRCLDSIAASADWAFISELRVGLNAVHPAVRRKVVELCLAVPVPAYTYAEVDGRNVQKYPLMRKMFHDPDHLLRGDRVMWFDDDSYVRGDVAWWGEVERRSRGQCMLGACYRWLPGVTPAEAEAFRCQPWYGGQDFPPGYQPTFVQGAWWVLPVALVRLWDWPVRELRHTGGDWLLGEVCRQQGVPFVPYNRDVAINADAAGRESRAPTRGTRRAGGPFAGWHEGWQPDLTHHDFEVAVTAFPKVSRHGIQDPLDRRPPELAHGHPAGGDAGEAARPEPR